LITTLTSDPILHTTTWSTNCPSGVVTVNGNITCTVTFSDGSAPITDACFADSDSSINFVNYMTALDARVNSVSVNRGYVLSDATRTEQNSVFFTRLAGNINKYITSAYCPDTNFPTEWSATSTTAAPIK